MKEFPRFIKLGDERINVEEIVSYGLAVDEDDERYLYVSTKTDEDFYQFYESDEFDIDKKIKELDDLFLIN